MSFPVARGNSGLVSNCCCGIGPHLGLRVSCGFPQVVAGGSGFLPSCNGDLGEPLGLQKGSQKLLSNYLGELRIALKWLQGNWASYPVEQRSHGFSRVVVGSLGFLSSCNGDLSELLYLPQGSQATFCVACRNWGFLSSQSRGFRHHLEMWFGTRCSS